MKILKYKNKKITKIVRSELPRYIEEGTDYGTILIVVFLSFITILIAINFL